MTLLSEIGKDNIWIKPEYMTVIKRTGIAYDSYWNEEDQKWGGLINATIYNSNAPVVENGEVVDYREITNTK